MCEGKGPKINTHTHTSRGAHIQTHKRSTQLLCRSLLNELQMQLSPTVLNRERKMDALERRWGRKGTEEGGRQTEVRMKGGKRKRKGRQIVKKTRGGKWCLHSVWKRYHLCVLVFVILWAVYSLFEASFLHLFGTWASYTKSERKGTPCSSLSEEA